MSARRLLLASVAALGFACSVPSHTLGANVEGGALACAPGFADCNANTDDGCEVDLAESRHCGACDARCDNGSCEASACVCAPRFADCDADATNGCEAELDRDPRHCGRCDVDCGPGDCAGGLCLPWPVVSAPHGILDRPAPHGDQVAFLDDGAIFEAPLDATTPIAQATRVLPQETAYALVLAGDRLVWSVRSSPSAIKSSALDGTDLRQLSQTPQPTNDLAGDATRVAWIDAGAASPRVWLATSPSGPPTPLYAPAPTDTLLALLGMTDELVVAELQRIVAGHAEQLLIEIPTAPGAALEVTVPAGYALPNHAASIADGSVCVPARAAPANGESAPIEILCAPFGATKLTPSGATFDACHGAICAASIARDGATTYLADYTTGVVLASAGGTTRAIAGPSTGLPSWLQVLAGGDLLWSTRSGVFRLRRP